MHCVEKREANKHGTHSIFLLGLESRLERRRNGLCILAKRIGEGHRLLFEHYRLVVMIPLGPHGKQRNKLLLTRYIHIFVCVVLAMKCLYLHGLVANRSSLVGTTGIKTRHNHGKSDVSGKVREVSTLSPLL